MIEELVIIILFAVYLKIGVMITIKEIKRYSSFSDNIFQCIFKILFYLVVVITWPLWYWTEL